MCTWFDALKGKDFLDFQRRRMEYRGVTLETFALCPTASVEGQTPGMTCSSVMVASHGSILSVLVFVERP